VELPWGRTHASPRRDPGPCRAGPTVSGLVFKSTKQRKVKGVEVAKQAQAAREAKERAQAKRDDLLKELESDETKLKKSKFLGLF